MKHLPIEFRTLAGVTGLTVIVVGTACHEPTVVTPIKPVVTAIAAASALTQTATVATKVASNPTVLVVDQQGFAVSNARVLFSSEWSSEIAVTSAAGMASIEWRLGVVAGPQTLIATVVDSRVRGVVFTALALADSIASIEPGSIYMQAGLASSPAPVTPSVVVVDAFHNGRAGIEVTFEVTGGGGSVAPALTTTDASGRATVERWTLGPDTGTNTLTVRALNFAPVTFIARVNAPFVASAVSAGTRHSCAIAESGSAYCWGRDNERQLGDTTYFASWSARPRRVALPWPLVTLASGAGHTCAITDETPSQAYCWGDNSSGQVGPASPTQPGGPVQIPVIDGLSMVTAGDAHSCGLTAVGEAWCWGAGRMGQLGSGDAEDHSLPVRVRGNLRFASLAAGARHTCGVTSGGVLFCWGLDDHRQLGVPSPASPSCFRVVYEEEEYYEPIACAVEPQLVSDAPPFVAIAAGYGTCGLTATGEVDCFGYSTRMVSPSRGLKIAQLAAGGACGLTTDGVGYCWAQSSEFESATVLNEPAVVANGFALRSITANGAHQCAIATGTNSAMCWGRNDNGQLGNGTIAPSKSPLPVARPEHP
jgi:alpha-tubulin suppressor-like RCC1 family protein